MKKKTENNWYIEYRDKENHRRTHYRGPFGKIQSMKEYRRMVRDGYRVQIGTLSTVGGIGMMFVHQEHNYLLTEQEQREDLLALYKRNYPKLHVIARGTDEFNHLAAVYPELIEKTIGKSVYGYIDCIGHLIKHGIVLVGRRKNVPVDITYPPKKQSGAGL